MKNKPAVTATLTAYRVEWAFNEYNAPVRITVVYAENEDHAVKHMVTSHKEDVCVFHVEAK